MRSSQLDDLAAESRRKMIGCGVLAYMCLTSGFGESAGSIRSERIHCVTDISHESSFYFDGRFGRNYVASNGVDVRNWGTLHKYDFTSANLLILQSSASPCPNPARDGRVSSNASLQKSIIETESGRQVVG